MTIEFETTDRGFKVMSPMMTDYGALITLQESSSAESPKIWFRIKEPDDLNAAFVAKMEEREYDGPSHEASAHMTFEQIDELIERLQWIKENHYHMSEF